MPPVTRVRVRGQKELERAFLELRREVLVGIKPALLEAGRIVAEEAQSIAPTEISNIGDQWNQFRIGATVKGVYIAPKRRRRGGSPRRNLGPLLLKVMEDAVERKQDEVVAAVGSVIDAAAVSFDA